MASKRNQNKTEISRIGFLLKQNQSVLQPSPFFYLKLNYTINNQNCIVLIQLLVPKQLNTYISLTNINNNNEN